MNQLSYIYLLQDGKHVGTSIYKIGRCTQANDTRTLQRLQAYSTGTVIKFLWNVSTEHVCEIERHVIDRFRIKFKLMFGREWFEGNMLDMKREIDNIVEKFNESLIAKSSSDNTTQVVLLEEPEVLQYRDQECVTHKCKRCPYMTLYKGNLTRHMKIHTQELANANKISRTCSWCNTEFSSKYNLQRHQKSRCPHDPSKLTERVHHSIEVQTEHDDINVDAKYGCATCFRSFNRPSKLEDHAIHCKGISNILECEYCHQMFASSSSKSHHMKRCRLADTNSHDESNEHESRAKIFPCPTCFRTYTRNSILQHHIPLCDKTQSILECPKCHQTLSSRQSKCKHIQRCTHT